ncbi:MAG: ABC transporter permease [Anaerolineae bacterium]|nr:ABC transporter permease [Anaerolineae bacterium]
MQKLLAIIWKENYLRFTDRTAAIFMFLTPLVLSAIMGLAFSGVGGSDITLNVPVGIVNLDEGGGSQGSSGEIFVNAFTTDEQLGALFDTRILEDEAEGRALVESGELTALLVIPADFSANLTPNQAAFMAAGEDPEAAQSLIGHSDLMLYTYAGSQVGAGIFRDVVQGIADGIATGNIAVSATVSGIVGAIPSNPLVGLQLAAGAYNDVFMQIGQEAGQPGASSITLEQVDVTGEQVEFDPLSYFSPGFAIFFMGFAVTVGSASILQEQQDWTLQRMVTTPTPRAIILGGKMLGTYVGGVLQMIILIVAMQLVGLVLVGPDANIWGDDILGIAVLTLSAVAGAMGVGTLLAAIAKTAEQAGNLAGFVLFVMGLVGGIFFPPLAMPDWLQFLPRLTFHFWGVNGYTTLASGGTVVDVLPNVLALLVIAAIFFGAGLFQFNRRIDL